MPSLDKVQLLNETGVVAATYENPVFTLGGDGRIYSISSRFATKVANIVVGSYSTIVTNFTQSYQPTNLSATITLSDPASKVLVLVAQTGWTAFDGTSNIQLRRNGVALDTVTFGYFTNNYVVYGMGSNSINYLDTPGAIGPHTYDTWATNASYTYGAGGAYPYTAVNVYNTGPGQGNWVGSTSTITLIEILP